MSKECTISKFDGCCCECKFRYNDWSHPHTNGNNISVLRGYICWTPVLGAMSGWDEHGMCEMFTPRPPRPTTRNEQEEWDNLYGQREKPMSSL